MQCPSADSNICFAQTKRCFISCCCIPQMILIPLPPCLHVFDCNYWLGCVTKEKPQELQEKHISLQTIFRAEWKQMLELRLLHMFWFCPSPIRGRMCVHLLSVMLNIFTETLNGPYWASHTKTHKHTHTALEKPPLLHCWHPHELR